MIEIENRSVLVRVTTEVKMGAEEGDKCNYKRVTYCDNDGILLYLDSSGRFLNLHLR